MGDRISRLLADDHARLDALFARATAVEGRGSVALEPYEEFRRGLLRHIAMEERVLLPAAQRLRGGEPLPIAARLRRDHALFAAMLVPTPTPDLLRRFRAVLAEHNALEEGPGGAYELCDALAANEVEALIAALEAIPEVKLKAHFDGPAVHKLIEDLFRAREAKAT